MDWSAIIIGILGGFVAGIINTISGSGSVITLSLMALFQIPADIANGSNRLGILVQGVKSSHSFRKKRKLKLEDNWKTILFCLIGAIAGTFTAVKISSESFNVVLGFIFSALLFIVIFEPQKRLKESKNIAQYIPWLMLPIGFYGGFIQVATGIFILTVLHVLTGKSIKEINPLKVFIIMLFNIPALLIFWWNDKINWELGIALAIGQFFGAILGVRINSTKKNIEPFLRYLLITLMVLAILKFWGFL